MLTINPQFKQDGFKYKPQKIAILLCTHQGQRFLAEQLASFAHQTYTDWALWCSDDGSEDGTLEMLQAFKNRFPKGKVSIINGPSDGFVSNFLSLTCNKNIDADYFAYADQDDIWKPEKLQRAVHCLSNIPIETPSLYCSRTELIHAHGQHMGFSPVFKKPPHFKNALIQNIGGGNTMLFNKAARMLITSAGSEVSVVSHDWWTYQLVSGAGGFVYYDPQPSLLYRQHDKNTIGMNITWGARFKRISMLLQGRFQEWNDRHTTELRKIKKILTQENQKTLETFTQGRDARFFKRLYQLRKTGIYRQTLLGNLGLIAAAILKKL